MLACVKMNLRVKNPNTGNKIKIKINENDNGGWWIMLSFVEIYYISMSWRRKISKYDAEKRTENIKTQTLTINFVNNG